jgi:predicted TIM-barrel fold metal-dependent hydrolase
MPPSQIHAIEKLIRFLEEHRDRLIIDADTHATDLRQLDDALRWRCEASPDYFQGRPTSAEDLLAEMRMAHIDMALIWQNPSATRYFDEPAENFATLLAANAYVRDAAQCHPRHFIPGGWIDPRALGLDLALELVDRLVTDFGFLFIKLNPAQNGYAIDSDSVRAVVRRIVEHGAIPAFHFGADTPYTPADGLERIAGMFPEHPVLAVHMGGGGAGYNEADELYLQARELGLRRPNIRYALSAKRDTHIESDLIRYQLAGQPYCRNIFFASDAPYGRMTWNVGGFRAMLDSLIEGSHHTDPRVRSNPGLFTPEVAQNYLGRNFADFIVAGYRRLLAVQRSRREEIQPVNQIR